MTASTRSRTPLVAGLVLLVLVGGAAIAYFAWPKPKPATPADMPGAIAANTRGVGLMDKYQYADAEKEFAEAVKLAPDWLTAKINRGIASMNLNTAESKAAAAELFKEVLAKEPDNKHAHYCMGIVLYDQGKFSDAYEHFVAVNKLDPDDPHTWLRMAATAPGGRESPEALKYYEQALKLNAYLNEARYGLAMALRVTDLDRATKLLEEKKALDDAKWDTASGIKYSEMGKYADVIGRDPSIEGKPIVGPIPMFEPIKGFNVKLADGARWATAADLDPLRKAARERFGASMVLFDYNRDGKTDIFLLSAVVENGKVRDLLLRNDGGGTFTDVTAAAGLATPRPSLAAAAGDYDNDGKPDLVITGAGEQHLFRNKGNGTFEDVSAAAGLDKIKGVCLGCAWLDLDQDGDLDLIICRYAESVEAAGTFAPKDAPTGGEVMVFENIGEAPPGRPDQPSPPLTTRFRKDDRFAAARNLAAVAPVTTDFDGDRDVDIIVLADRQSPIPVENDRLMRFHRTTPTWVADKPQLWNGGLVLDVNHDERSDLFFIAAGAPPVFLLSKGTRDFEPGHTNSPPLKQAVAADIDMDGWTDVVGLGTDGKVVLLHNLADGRLEVVSNAFGETEKVIGLGVADLSGDCRLDLLLWTETGLELRRNLGNENHAVLVEPSGLRRRGSNFRELPTPERTNADGIGAWISSHTGPNWTGAERTTVCAGLGQSLLPTPLGIGKNAKSDAIRIRWPDGVIQAEVGVTSCPVFRLEEYDRKPSSCPVLFTWDGEKFVFITDILGAGSVGESNPDGSARPPRPEESIKIEPNQLKPKDGKYIIKLAEPMDEIMYLDRVRLIAVDHPSDVAVFPDERFATADPQPTQEILAFRNRHFPKKAVDHRGTDVTAKVLERDRTAVDGFAKRSWLGFAEDHSLTLDFGNVPAGSGGNWHLVLASWTEYAYPETIYGASRAGVEMQFPVLEQLVADGKTWTNVCELGFPAGLSRVMTCPLPGFKPGQTTFRIRTNMQVFWDQIYLAEAVPGVAREVALDPETATLSTKGFMQEVMPDGRPPVEYDYSRLENVPVTRWQGNLTRLGDVTELLKAKDDRFAICGPGDEVTVTFDANKLPELPKGWTRSFVLRSWGYCKDAALTTQTGGTVGPLPFAAMKNYPDFGGVKPPVTDAEKWNTRPAGGR